VVALLGGGPLRSDLPDTVVLHELVDAGHAAKGFALAWLAFPKLASLMRAVKPDAVLSTMSGTNLLTVLACTLTHLRARLVLREAASLVNAKSILKRQAMRWLYRRADALIAVSAGVAGDLRSLGLAEDRIHVIHNPVDASRLRHLADVGTSLVRQDKLPYVVSIGRLVEQKDQQTLLRSYSMSALRESHHLVIVGEGKQRVGLERLALDLGIADRLILTGVLDNPYRVLAEASLHALSSRWEGYPNVLLEALALGVPVVSTDCPFGPREMLDSGRYGRLVPMDDPVALAHAMEEELVRPSVDIENVVAAHSPRKIASLYLDVLDEQRAVIQS